LVFLAIQGVAFVLLLAALANNGWTGFTLESRSGNIEFIFGVTSLTQKVSGSSVTTSYSELAEGTTGKFEMRIQTARASAAITLAFGIISLLLSTLACVLLLIDFLTKAIRLNSDNPLVRLASVNNRISLIGASAVFIWCGTLDWGAGAHNILHGIYPDAKLYPSCALAIVVSALTAANTALHVLVSFSTKESPAAAYNPNSPPAYNPNAPPAYNSNAPPAYMPNTPSAHAETELQENPAAARLSQAEGQMTPVYPNA